MDRALARFGGREQARNPPAAGALGLRARGEAVAWRVPRQARRSAAASSAGNEAAARIRERGRCARAAQGERHGRPPGQSSARPGSERAGKVGPLVMRRFPIGLFIIVVSAVMLFLGWRIYGPGEMGRFAPAIRAQHAPSELYARMTIKYPKPPIYQESYRMSDVEGVSLFEYEIRGYRGHVITVKAPAARVYDVSFFFGLLGQDGIWQLVDKPPLPEPDAFYTVYVKQLADYKQGDR